MQSVSDIHHGHKGGNKEDVRV